MGATLSPQAEQVRVMLENGTAISTIAEAMGTTKQSVYNHRRKLISAGLVTAETPIPPAKPAAKPTNGVVESPYLTRLAGEVEEEMARVANEIATTRQALARHEAEHKRLTTFRDALRGSR